MYTHLYFTPEDAKRLFEAYARKPLRPGESGAVTEATFEGHFRQYLQTYLDPIGAVLKIVRHEELFVLKFNDYLSRMPKLIANMGISPVRAEIVRFNSAPTRARAGFYEDSKSGFSARVERVFPEQNTHYRKSAPMYAQNIRVSGPSLEAVQRFNTRLCSGDYGRFLVDAFE